MSVLYLTYFPHVLEAIVLCATPFFTFYQNNKNTVCSSTFKIIIIIIFNVHLKFYFIILGLRWYSFVILVLSKCTRAILFACRGKSCLVCSMEEAKAYMTSLNSRIVSFCVCVCVAVASDLNNWIACMYVWRCLVFSCFTVLTPVEKKGWKMKQFAKSVFCCLLGFFFFFFFCYTLITVVLFSSNIYIVLVLFWWFWEELSDWFLFHTPQIYQQLETKVAHFIFWMMDLRLLGIREICLKELF